MERTAQPAWDREEMDRLLGIALARVREVKPGAANSRVRQAAGEVEAAYRLRRPASLHAALVELHQELDAVERSRAKRKERVRG